MANRWDWRSPESELRTRARIAALIPTWAERHGSRIFNPTTDQGFAHPECDDDELPYEVFEPDAFFVLADDSAPHIIRSVTREQTMYWCAKRGQALPAQQLEAARCPEFAQRVRGHQSGLLL